MVHLNHFVSSFGISVLKVASMIEDEPNSEIRQKARGKQTPWKNFLIKYLTVVCIIPQKFEIYIIDRILIDDIVRLFNDIWCTNIKPFLFVLSENFDNSYFLCIL